MGQSVYTEPLRVPPPPPVPASGPSYGQGTSDSTLPPVSVPVEPETAPPPDANLPATTPA